MPASQTTNLDGESNLKVRTALVDTKHLVTDAAIGGFAGVIKCGPPDEKLYKFDSQLRVTVGACVRLPALWQLAVFMCLRIAV